VNDERRPVTSAAATSRTFAAKDTWSGRCPTCGGRLTVRCVICRGFPDPGVTVEDLARGVAQVDTATGRPHRPASLVDLLRIGPISAGTAS
jgi:predicted RNA-binding Zn-ribbon protein involved in translation (DUF1610 family)